MYQSQRPASLLNFLSLSTLLLFLPFTFFLKTTAVLAQQNYDVETKLLASDGAANEQFGNSAAIEGNYSIIGKPGDNGGIGAAYIFQFDGNNWIEKQKLTPIDGALSYGFGNGSISMSGNNVLIGAVGYNNNAGSAYIFSYNGSSWIEKQKLTAI